MNNQLNDDLLLLYNEYTKKSIYTPKVILKIIRLTYMRWCTAVYSLRNIDNQPSAIRIRNSDIIRYEHETEGTIYLGEFHGA